MTDETVELRPIRRHIEQAAVDLTFEPWTGLSLAGNLEAIRATRRLSARSVYLTFCCAPPLPTVSRFPRRHHARRLLDDYEKPKLDARMDEALQDYMARRKREIPVAMHSTSSTDRQAPSNAAETSAAVGIAV
ncbi:trimethylamine methyltransferase family protein [Shinella daejeonensis]|uniref:trimethylamine methyltransferase family protein n=1 Tax=Shinella daejeonensis TaxID=659017 RepID=UPI0020C8230D|nr:trimethylamine methyltransferase family protein [Shinella daejeonensis]